IQGHQSTKPTTKPEDPELSSTLKTGSAHSLNGKLFSFTGFGLDTETLSAHHDGDGGSREFGTLGMKQEYTSDLALVHHETLFTPRLTLLSLRS
ncbi:hypothetical protein QTP86_020728, partial [Hemibagrus guttatus]